jgi:antibiotic biosynthesis monooxygenase (ABM) superfamily enzyme
MNMDEVGKLLDRPKQYYNIDGLGELGCGILSLGYGLFMWLEMHSPATAIWHKISIFILLGLVMVIHYGTKALKTLVTYPRTGFVEYRKDARLRNLIIGGALGGLTSLTLALSVSHHWDISTLLLLFGPVFAIGYGYAIARAVRWKWVIAAAFALTSVVIAFLPTDFLAILANDSPAAHPVRARIGGTMLISLLTYGALFIVSGGISFWHYLRHTEPAALENL